MIYAFFDWLNEKPYIILGVCILIFWLCNCQSTQQADSAKHEIQVEQAKDDIDTAIDCKVQIDPVRCKKAVEKAKNTMDEGVKLNEKKDSTIDTVQKENIVLKEKADDWDTMWFYIYWLIGVILFCLALKLLWSYRFWIARVAGIPIPPWFGANDSI